MFWQDLHERFSKIDRIHNATLYSSFNNLKQGTKSVLDYHWVESTLGRIFLGTSYFQIVCVLILVVVKLLKLLRFI